MLVCIGTVDNFIVLPSPVLARPRPSSMRAHRAITSNSAFRSPSRQRPTNASS